MQYTYSQVVKLQEVMLRKIASQGLAAFTAALCGSFPDLVMTCAANNYGVDWSGDTAKSKNLSLIPFTYPHFYACTTQFFCAD